MVVGFLFLASACSGATLGERPGPSAAGGSANAPNAGRSPSAERAAGSTVSAPVGAEPDCADPAPVYADGQRTDRQACDGSDYTVVSLADDWTPRLLRESPELGERGQQPYRDTYLALANEDFGALDDEDGERRFLELYGIFPTRSVLQGRMDDEDRHRCHGAIDDGPLEDFDGQIRFRWDQEMRGRFAQRHERRSAYVERILEDDDNLSEPEDLEGHPEHGALYERYLRSRRAFEAIDAAQQHLACEGSIELDEVQRGALDATTMRAMRAFQRKHLIVGRGHLAADTVEALARDSRQLDYEATLRTLRERVADAAGLLADGSAAHAHASILGRELDPEELRFRANQPAAPNGAPDLIARATETAARALGLTSPERTPETLETLPDRVALRLPPAPHFRSRDGSRVLWAELHRGDSVGRYGRDDVVRPVLTVYALDGDEPVALVRWPTTIGGVKEAENEAGWVREKYFESPTGEFVWRDVVASPAWLPPPSTPDEALTLGPSSDWRPNEDLLRPGYQSAYGLAMLVHHRPRETGEGEINMLDQGIRSHGSVSYRSIVRGTSHGCHRLYNHLAVRLASYLLAHRRHVRQGNEAVSYRRVVRHNGQSATISVRSRGYFYELDPPVQVLVVDGAAPGPADEPARFTLLDE